VIMELDAIVMVRVGELVQTQKQHVTETSSNTYSKGSAHKAMESVPTAKSVALPAMFWPESPECPVKVMEGGTEDSSQFVVHKLTKQTVVSAVHVTINVAEGNHTIRDNNFAAEELSYTNHMWRVVAVGENPIIPEPEFAATEKFTINACSDVVEETRIDRDGILDVAVKPYTISTITIAMRPIKCKS